jgi:MFS family permease
MVATMIPKITTHFQSLEDIGWYGSAYPLALGSFQRVTQKLYTYYSIKWAYIVSLLVSVTGNAISGSAPNSTVLIIGRTICGVGSAGLFSGALIIVAYSIPLHKRPKYTTLVVATYNVAYITAPILAGALSDRVSWRWCFYLQLPVGGLIIGTVGTLFRSPERPAVRDIHWHTKMKELDLVGIFIFIAALLSLLLALNWGGMKYAWGDARIIALLALFGILFCCFIIIQIRNQDKSTVPPQLLKRRSVLAATWFAFTLGASSEILILYLPIWFQTVKHASALKSGIMNLPIVLTLVVNSFFSKLLTFFLGSFTDSDLGIMAVTFLGYYAPFMIGSSVLSAVGFGMLSTFTPESNHAAWIGYQALAGIGMGMGMQMPFKAVQTVLDISIVPAGTVLIISVRNVGAAISISISQSIFTNKLVSGLKRFEPLLDPAIVLVNGAANLKKSVEPQYLKGVLLAYNYALTSCFTAAAAIAATTVIGSLAIGQKSVKGKRLESGDP